MIRFLRSARTARRTPTVRAASASTSTRTTTPSRSAPSRARSEEGSATPAGTARRSRMEGIRCNFASCSDPRGRAAVPPRERKLARRRRGEDRRTRLAGREREECGREGVDEKAERRATRGRPAFSLQSSTIGCGPGMIPAISGSTPGGASARLSFSFWRSTRTTALSRCFCCRARSLFRLSAPCLPIHYLLSR
jgi:hypothetical protein